MTAKFTKKQIQGVWSATPTPLTDSLKIDKLAVNRLVEHHVRLGVKGFFLCGTCGEGPWLTDNLRADMLRYTVAANQKRMLISMQVTDNSEIRMLKNIESAHKLGADIAIIAPPYMPLTSTPDRLLKLYIRTIEASTLPVGVYDRGQNGAVIVPFETLKELYTHPKVILVKDSSADESRRAPVIAIRNKRKDLFLMNGWEFNCVPYLQDGYDGLLLGGGIFNGFLANLIIKAVKKGDIKKANQLQERMNRLMYDVYGEKIGCWLSGLKYLLVEMGIFRTHLNILDYPLTEACKQAIQRVLTEDRDVLFP